MIFEKANTADIADLVALRIAFLSEDFMVRYHRKKQH